MVSILQKYDYADDVMLNVEAGTAEFQFYRSTIMPFLLEEIVCIFNRFNSTEVRLCLDKAIEAQLKRERFNSTEVRLCRFLVQLFTLVPLFQFYRSAIMTYCLSHTVSATNIVSILQKYDYASHQFS